MSLFAHLRSQDMTKTRRVFRSACGKRSVRRLGLLAGAVLAVDLAAEKPAGAMTINLSFDSTVTILGNASTVENACNYAAGQISNLFTNPETININVVASGTNGL